MHHSSCGTLASDACPLMRCRAQVVVNDKDRSWSVRATPAEVEAASAAMEGVRVLQLDVRDKGAVDALVGGFAQPS